MTKSLTLLRAFSIAMGVMCILAGLLFATVAVLGGLGVIEPDEPRSDRIGGAVGGAGLAVVLLAMAGAHLATAHGIARLLPWARTLGLVMGAIDIVCCCGPIGLPLGIFTLVVLLDQQNARLFEPTSR